MNTKELEDILSRNQVTKNVFQGVFAVDQLPKRNRKIPGLYIVNTDSSSEPGEHWIAIFFPEAGKPEYFDSFGLRPWKSEILNLLLPTWKENKTLVQHPMASTCGQHCVFFSYMRCSGQSFKTVLKYYSSNLKFNDLFVEKFVKEMF